MKKKKNKLRVFIEVIIWVVFAIIIGLIGFTTLSSSQSSLPFKSFLIQSGSMEPTIMTGDIIIVTPTNDYKQRDVITFKDHGGRVVTHRIMEVEDGPLGEQYITQGDANQDLDMAAVPKEDVIGEVFTHLPKVGFLVAYSKTKWGIVLLIIVPATIIIYDEISKIKSEVEDKKEKN